MSFVIAGTARVGLVVLVGAVLAVGCSDGAAAKARKALLRHRGLLSAGRGSESTTHLQSVSQQQVRLGPMRYYGGPKSPMWRGPVED
jgi:hypothetical protein